MVSPHTPATSALSFVANQVVPTDLAEAWKLIELLCLGVDDLGAARPRVSPDRVAARQRNQEWSPFELETF